MAYRVKGNYCKICNWHAKPLGIRIKEISPITTFYDRFSRINNVREGFPVCRAAGSKLTAAHLLASKILNFRRGWTRREINSFLPSSYRFIKWTLIISMWLIRCGIWNCTVFSFFEQKTVNKHARRVIGETSFIHFAIAIFVNFPSKDFGTSRKFFLI